MFKTDKITVSLWRKVRELQQQVNQTVGAVWGTIEGNISNQTDLQSALNNKADKSDVLLKNNTNSYTPTSDYHPATKKYVDDNAGGGSGSVSWGSISGTLSNQTDLQNELNNKSDATHNHQISDVSNLQTALNNKADIVHTHIKSDITDFSHTHSITDINNLQTSLDGKANASHTHTKSEITDFTHTHSIADIDNLQTTLASKVNLTGNETIAGIKTFSSFPILPGSAPTTDYEAATKKYVDDKTAGGGGGGTDMTYVILSADVINNNATANTLQDTGLEFTVLANKTYFFEAIIPYTSQATTTGSRWVLNGPTLTMLSMRSEYTLTATSVTNNSVSAYNSPTSANASSLLSGNIATLWGIIKCSASGLVKVRFASEVASSAITAKAGAFLRYKQLD